MGPGVRRCPLVDKARRLLIDYSRFRDVKAGKTSRYLIGDKAYDSAEEAGDFQLAESLYRRVMNLDPNDPAAGLNLGNLLRVQNRTVEAEAAYRRVAKADPKFAPAWHNLADLLDESGRLTEAVDCARRALTADPEYADAMFNLALFLQRLGNHAEAAIWWTRYLERDRTSQWAERAKRALKYCKMELATAASRNATAQATERA